jgi:hypothetical protein
MKPYLHAKNSVKRHQGRWEDYIQVHDFLDHLPMLDWLGGPKRKLTKYSMVD